FNRIRPLEGTHSSPINLQIIMRTRQQSIDPVMLI
ncbi:hypothetical protein A2U01_0112146, partial [Trifolium medium]|nr:hypothetical protein [Trifolium medium]